MVEPAGGDVPPINRSVGYAISGDRDFGPERYVVHNYGNTRYSEVARLELTHENRVFNYSHLSDAVLDAILDMPVGFRTRSANSLLSGFPIGLIIHKLRNRAFIRFGSDSIIGSLVFVGTFIRFKNRQDLLAPVPSINDPDIPYYPKAISRDVDAFYFVRLPLDRVMYEWPFVGLPEDAITPTTFHGYPNISLIDYMRDFTIAEGGSDVSFFVMGSGAYILKQFHNFSNPGGYDGDFRRFRTKMIRTAGLRQVLFRSFSSEFVVTSNHYDRIFSMYIPGGGEGNCFEGALRWGYKKNSILTEEQAEISFRTTWRKILAERASKRKKKTVGEYESMYVDSGFPVSELRELSLSFYWITGYKVALWYRKRHRDSGEWVNLLHFKSYIPASNPTVTVERPTLGVITIFQCIDTGEIRDDYTYFAEKNTSSTQAESEDFESRAKEGELGRMMHCIALHPTPFFFLNSNADNSVGARVSQTLIKRGRVDLVQSINVRSKDFFDEMYRCNRYWNNITLQNVVELVNLQKNRYKEKSTKTLIFNESSGGRFAKKAKLSNTNDSNNDSPPRWRVRQLEERGGAPEYFVFAYDLETVTNVQELHQIQGKVWEPFRDERFNHLTYEQQSLYEPGDNQIPFSAQWVPVNVSDTGDYLSRKQQEFTDRPNKLDTTLIYTADETSENPEFFLSEARTEDGGGLLGRCIEDMLINIATYTHVRGGKQAICYAHNGAHFDAFIVLQYQRFQVTNILKTSRGVMTVSIRVPIIPSPPFDYDYQKDDADVPKVTIVLRDTMLQVPGSLARLCKGFNVPAQYCKLDFPIQKVNGFNYNHPAISKLLREYGENDVKGLAVIIVRINNLIGASPWKPANIDSLKPPIVQFVTCMGMIRASTRLHFKRIFPEFLLPKAIDVKALRYWLQNATIGGRVNAYAKTYTSRYAGAIMQAALSKNVPLLQQLYTDMISDHQCIQVLDVTSLYPFAMDSCPMPTGPLYSLNEEECWRAIQAIHCDECDRLLSLCPIHRCYFNAPPSVIHRPFCIIVVRNVVFINHSKKRNMCPRKSFLSTTGKATSLVYSLENNDQYTSRTEGREEIRGIQSFTNVDLYWMRRQGYRFEVIGGFGFQTSMAYNLFIGPAFQNRIKAKQEGNKLLSDFLKLNYNGSFGITTQHDIDETYDITRIDEKFKFRDPRDSEVRSAIYLASRGENGIESMETLTGEAVYLPSKQIVFQKKKKEHLGEYFSDQSPMQIGAAVLSWSRHVGNLIMFNIDEEDVLYTDTDSFAVSDKITLPQYNLALSAKICNRDDAALGTLKNDHAENNGSEPRVFFSMIGTKKVKCHMTLNQEGKIRIFNTFKGLNVSTEDEENGIIRHPDYAEYVCAQTLLHLNVDSASPPVLVSSWKRDLQHGVNISNHIQTLSPNTYLEDCVGTLVCDKDYGTVEFFIPHGCTVVPHFPVERNTITGECSQGFLRKENLLSQIWKGIDSTELVSCFIDDYYQGTSEEYNPGTEEYKKILEAFNSITL